MSQGSTISKSASCFSRFLSSEAWSRDDMMKAYLNKIRYIFSRTLVTLILDDSTIKKSGRHIFGAKYHRDHVTSGYVFGHQIVTALLHSANCTLPLFPMLYYKKTLSKISLAKGLIKLACSKVRVHQVVMDSWYVCEEILKLCREKKIQLIGAIKSNRCIKLGNKWIKLNSYSRRKVCVFAEYSIDENKYLVHEFLAELKTGGFVKILVARQWNPKKKKWSKRIYLVSTNTSRPVVDIIRTYTIRWKIEVFHKDLKQNLGLEQGHVRGHESITRHLMLVVIAYAVLCLHLFWSKTKATIGECIMSLQGKSFDDLIITIVEEPDPTKRWELARPFLSETA